MAAAKVFKMDGAEVGTAELNDAVFNVEPNPGLVHEVAVALQNAKRQGNAETKTRKEVSGGGIKPYRQKGTGRARHGSSREPQMRGGGVVFGPHKRDYKQNVPVATKRRAICCVLSDRLRNESLCVLEGLTCGEPKTKPFAQMMGKFRAGGEKALLIVASDNKNVLLSSRNLARVSVKTAADLNALDVLDARKVIVEQEAIAKLEERLS